MHAPPREAPPRAGDAHDEPDRRRPHGRDGAQADRDDPRAPGSRIDAAQMAAPSTRRWRRTGRFASTR